MTTHRETTYLTRLLTMNPLDQTPEIMAIRRHFLQQDDDAPIIVEDDAATQNQRRRLLERRISTLSREFWTLDDAALTERLSSIDAKAFADLSILVNRMKAVAERRQAFRRLKEHPDCFPQFFEAFCRLAIAPQREATKLRADQLAVARRGSGYPDYRSRTEYLRIAQTVEQEFPELHVLEEQWLRQIVKGSSGGPAPKRSAAQYFWFAVVVYLSMQLLCSAVLVPVYIGLGGENGLAVYALLAVMIAAIVLLIRWIIAYVNSFIVDVYYTLIRVLCFSAAFIVLKSLIDLVR